MSEAQSNISMNESPSPGIKYQMLGTRIKRKQHNRRTATEIMKEFVCPFDACDKFFGSEGSQNLHIKIKHNGGTKTERDKLATQIIQAYAESAKHLDDKDPNVVIPNEIIDQIDLNLPPGLLTKTA